MPKRARESRPHQVNVRLSDDAFRRLSLVAMAENSDRAELVREAIEQLVQGRFGDEDWVRDVLEPYRKLFDGP